MKTKLSFLLLCGLLIHTLTTSAQYSNIKPLENSNENFQRTSKFEIGFHYGSAWTPGDVKEFAKNGGAFSLDLGVNSGTFYFGTELTFTSWTDFVDSQDAEELNFEESNFLWLVHTKLFLGEGKVKPYLGIGTDLISLGEAILDSEDDDCYHNSYHCACDDEPNYNAWFVPSFGIRFAMGPDVSGNIGFSVNSSRDYTFTRLQIGIVF